MEPRKRPLIAVDYDDTITLHRPYPERAPLNPKAKKYLDKLHEKGYEIVLWSARHDESNDDAYNRCITEFGLTYLIQDDVTKYKHGKTGKLWADFYIDDHSYINRKVNWKKIYKYIIKTFKVQE